MAQAARDELKEKKDKALQEKQQLEVTVCRLVSYMLEASPYSHHLVACHHTGGAAADEAQQGQAGVGRGQGEERAEQAAAAGGEDGAEGGGLAGAWRGMWRGK